MMSNEPPQGAQSADPANTISSLLDRLCRASDLRSTLHREYMGKAMPNDVYQRFDAARSAVGELTRQIIGLAAPEGPAPEPDCWAILTPNGSMLVSPDEAKGRKGAYPLYRAPEAPPPVEARQPIAWVHPEVIEQLRKGFDGAVYLHVAGTKEFGEVPLYAALAAPAGAIQPHLDHQVDSSSGAAAALGQITGQDEFDAWRQS